MRFCFANSSNIIIYEGKNGGEGTEALFINNIFRIRKYFFCPHQKRTQGGVGCQRKKIKREKY